MSNHLLNDGKGQSWMAIGTMEMRLEPKELNFYRLQGISILLFTNFFCVIFIEDETRFCVFKLAY